MAKTEFIFRMGHYRRIVITMFHVKILKVTPKVTQGHENAFSAIAPRQKVARPRRCHHRKAWLELYKKVFLHEALAPTGAEILRFEVGVICPMSNCRVGPMLPHGQITLTGILPGRSDTSVKLTVPCMSQGCQWWQTPPSFPKEASPTQTQLSHCTNSHRPYLYTHHIELG